MRVQQDFTLLELAIIIAIIGILAVIAIPTHQLYASHTPISEPASLIGNVPTAATRCTLPTALPNCQPSLFPATTTASSAP